MSIRSSKFPGAFRACFLEYYEGPHPLTSPRLAPTINYECVVVIGNRFFGVDGNTSEQFPSRRPNELTYPTPPFSSPALLILLCRS